MSVRILLIGACLLPCGCSAYIADCGITPSSFESKKIEYVHKKYGKPVQSAVKDGQLSEIYRSRRKYSHWFRGPSNAMAVAMTFGLAEVVRLPTELFLLVRSTIRGQEVEVTYDREGNVEQVLIDGEGFFPAPWD